MAAKKLGMVQGLMAEVRASRVALSAMPAPSFKSKAAAPASKGGSRSAAVKKAWQTRKG